MRRLESCLVDRAGVTTNLNGTLLDRGTVRYIHGLNDIAEFLHKTSRVRNDLDYL